MLPLCSTAIDAYLCTLSYTSQYLPGSAPRPVTKVHRLVPAEESRWGHQVWNKDVKLGVAAAQERMAGQALRQGFEG